MRYYPIQLDIQGKHVVVVGGGEVAFQKVSTLLKGGAHIEVISPVLCSSLQVLWNQKKIHWKQKLYETGDLKGATLAFGATNNVISNQHIHADALKEGILFNAVDQPADCDFIVPAHFERGDLMLTFSTSGSLPWFSKKLRQQFEREWGEEYAEFLEWAKPLRQKYLSLGQQKKFVHFLDKNQNELLIYFKTKQVEQLTQKLNAYMKEA